MSLTETKIPLFVIPVIVATSLQFIKILIDHYKRKEKIIKLSDIRRSGWLPSVHSAITSSILMLVLLETWIHSLEFAMAMGFASLFWYDAMNIRYEAGKHAYHINKISLELQDVLNLSNDRNLKERLWHNELEVFAWIISWFVLTYILYGFMF